jgi:hypothetical protein
MLMHRSSAIGALTVAGFFAMPAAPATADDQACGERDKLVGTLQKTYREKPIALGLSQDGSLVELLASADGSTWTILVTLPNGSSCIATAGEDWQPLVSNTMLPTAYRP